MYPPDHFREGRPNLSNDNLGRFFVIVSKIDVIQYNEWMDYLRTLIFPRKLQYQSNAANRVTTGTLPIFHEHFWLCSLEEPEQDPITVCIQLVYLEENRTKTAIKHCAPRDCEVLQIYRPKQRTLKFNSMSFSCVYFFNFSYVIRKCMYICSFFC